MNKIIFKKFLTYWTLGIIPESIIWATGANNWGGGITSPDTVEESAWLPDTIS